METINGLDGLLYRETMVRPDVAPETCVRCKGARLLCGKPSCPILLQHSVLKSTIPKEFKLSAQKMDLFGASPPAVFVGHVGYPKVNIGPLIPIEVELKLKNTSYLDSPETWFGKSIDEIIKYRVSLIRSNFNMDVKYNEDFRSQLSSMEVSAAKLLESTQELAMASNSVDTEATLEKIHTNIILDSHAPPQGPAGEAKKIIVVDNVKVEKTVDKVVHDTDLKSNEAIFDVLYLEGHQTLTSIQRLLSAGLLGQSENRKLVPTRWSITAADDIIAKGLKQKIMHFPTVDKYYSFYGEYLDNKFLIILAPGPFMYEMMECWNANTIWTQYIDPTAERKDPIIVDDYEYERGRKDYASNVTGAYYAAQKEILEFLWKHNRTATVFVIREVSGGYLVPLGVWVIRETVKNAMTDFTADNCVVHETLDDAFMRLKHRFNVEPKVWKKTSNLLKYLNRQKTLDYWLKR